MSAPLTPPAPCPSGAPGGPLRSCVARHPGPPPSCLNSTSPASTAARSTRSGSTSTSAPRATTSSCSATRQRPPELVRRLLEDTRGRGDAPADWCYAWNFANAAQPRLLRCPAARPGARDDLARFVEELVPAIGAVFEARGTATASRPCRRRPKTREESACAASATRPRSSASRCCAPARLRLPADEGRGARSRRRSSRSCPRRASTSSASTSARCTSACTA